MKKRILSILLVLCMIFAQLPVYAFATATESDSGECGEAVYWTLDSKGTLTISGNGKMTSAPWRTDYTTVIKKVIIEDGVTSIYGSAFDSCTSLTEVIIADSVTYIGSFAFDYCTSLTDAALPNGLVNIDSYAFRNCALNSVEIPTTLSNLGSWSFSSCPIEDLYISDLTHFLSLNQVSAGLEFKNLYVNGELVTDLVIPETVTVIPGSSFDGVKSLESVTIPDSVTTIGTYAFYGCENLKEVKLPGTVSSIQSYVFGKCTSLESLTLPIGVLVINSDAFGSSDYYYKSSLKELKIMGNAPLIAGDAFEDVTATVYYSANNASWTADVLQNYGGEITWVADGTIPGTDAGSDVVIMDSGECGNEVSWTLDSKGTLRVFGSGKMTSAPWRTDYTTVIKKVIIEDGVTSIYGSAFDSCTSLTEAIIADSVTYIGSFAFDYCTSLTDAALPNGLVNIDSYAFRNCALNFVEIPTTLSNLGSWSFSSCPIEDLYISDLTHFLSLNQVSAGLEFKNLYVNGELVTDLVIPETVTVIPGSSFDGVKSLESVTIPDSVTTIGTYAFYGCENLKEVKLPGTVSSIQSYVFGKCTSLESLTLPIGVLVINSDAFGSSDYYYKSSLKELKIMGNAPLIAGDAFEDVTATVYYSANNASWTADVLQNYGGEITWIADENISGSGMEEEVYIIARGTCGENVYWTLNSRGQLQVYGNAKTSSVAGFAMDDYASPEDAPWYAYRDYIRQVTVETTVSSVGDNAFASCDKLEQVVVAEGVQEIGSGAFAECESLTEVTFEGDAPEFGEACFENVDVTVNYPAGNESWNEEVLESTGGTITLVAHVHEYTETVTEPGCTKEGFTTHTCSCGSSYLDSYVDALGHNWDDGVVTKEPTEEATGTKHFTCERCDETKKETLPKLDSQPMPEAEVAVARMILGNELAMQFAFLKENIVEGVEYVVSVTKTYADGRADKNILVPQSEWKTNGPYYYVSFNGIAAKEMGDTINVQILTADGTAVGGVYTDSVKAYAVRQLRKATEAEIRTLYVDMLNYGAAAQTYFKYDAENLVTDGLTPEEMAYGTKEVKLENNLVKGTGYVASQLDLGSSILLRVKFNGIDSSMHAVVSFTSHTGAQKNVTIPGSEFISGGTVVVIDDVVAADYNQDVTITVYDADGKEVANAVESVASYLARQLEKDNPLAIYDAVAKYCAAAYGYLHK